MLSDEQQILNLCFTYPEILDTGDHEKLGRLFAKGQMQCLAGNAADCGVNVGAAGVKAFYDGAVLMHDGSPRTRHVISNVILEIGEDRRSATTRAYFHVFQQAPGLVLQVIAGGRYEDVYAKDEEGWHFVSKTIFADYFGDVSKHATAVAAQA